MQARKNAYKSLFIDELAAELVAQIRRTASSSMPLGSFTFFRPLLVRSALASS